MGGGVSTRCTTPRCLATLLLATLFASAPASSVSPPSFPPGLPSGGECEGSCFFISEYVEPADSSQDGFIELYKYC